MDITRGKDFTLKKVRSKGYPPETITDAVYVDYLALLTNTRRVIGLFVNKDKTEFMCFKQNGNISTTTGKLSMFVIRR